jgi:hypothetical protein
MIEALWKLIYYLPILNFPTPIDLRQISYVLLCLMPLLCIKLLLMIYRTVKKRHVSAEQSLER